LPKEVAMDVIHDCVAGLDVHKDTVVACVRTMSGTRATRECRTYGTTTNGLLALLEWLSASGYSVVAMEATGVSWPLPPPRRLEPLLSKKHRQFVDAGDELAFMSSDPGAKGERRRPPDRRLASLFANTMRRSTRHSRRPH
jgi:hypothetical protein